MTCKLQKHLSGKNKIKGRGKSILLILTHSDPIQDKLKELVNLLLVQLVIPFIQRAY